MATLKNSKPESFFEKRLLLHCSSISSTSTAPKGPDTRFATVMRLTPYWYVMIFKKLQQSVFMRLGDNRERISHLINLGARKPNLRTVIL